MPSALRGPWWILPLLLAACSHDLGYRVNRDALSLPVATIKERWVSAPLADETLDSMATVTDAAGRMDLLVTAKTGNRIVVYDGDDGHVLRSFGTRGDAAGQLNRPNGIALIDGVAWIAERDAHRVQLFDAVNATPLGEFGTEVLRAPYGVYVQALGGGDYRVYVTDNYLTPDLQVPPIAELGKRVKQFSVRLDPETHQLRNASAIGAFGDTSGKGVLHIVESILGDPAHDQLLIAEEDANAMQGIQVYSLDGRYRDQRAGEGVFAYQPEGIALLSCTDGSGFWVASDQDAKGQRYHVFARGTLKHLGSFRGERTRATDGVWIEPASFGRFAHGALFVQSDDRSVAAFALDDIAHALQLPKSCATAP